MTVRQAWLQESAAHGVIGAQLGARIFGLPIATIREITYASDLTEVPRSSDLVVGLVNLRGQIVTVIDAAYRLGVPRNPNKNAGQRLVVLKTNSELSAESRAAGIETSDEKVAILVDGVTEVYRMPIENFQLPTPNINAAERQHIFAVCEVGEFTMVCVIPPGLVQPEPTTADTWFAEERPETP